MLTFAESTHTQYSDPRVQHPEERLKAKVVENCRYTIVPTRERLKLFFAVNQLSIYGAVAEMCEECDSCHDRTWRLVVEGQSDPLFVPTSSLMKTHTPLTDDPAQPEDLLKRYQERVERPSQQNRDCRVLTIHRFSGLS